MEPPSPNPTSLETVAIPGGAAAITQPEISRLTSTSSVEDEGRFPPGALLGGRYRILGLLGRGGMGEVYRATDLMLAQPVALKFLPQEASHNPRLLERFHGEVRVARLVSHPNVCRVFDIGEVEGMPFISMEYVDGEDLASLLTRIGRLPGDKALEAARKLCAGLAAAHDRGVIHRDLKPQNIMINKRGDIVIMDFGLAAIADQLSGPEVRNGTPAYMSPEQLKGAAVTTRSDIYSLGLVLFELFTGKRPFEARSLQQLIDMQETAQFPGMTTIAADIDPTVEKVIRRCLDPDPLKRPAGALSISGALPGGDPLAAALAAGETPSPEMVASAGKVEGLPRKWALLSLAVIAACLFLAPWLHYRESAFLRSPLEDPPDVLAHQARQIARSFGYPSRPGDSAVWLEHRSALVKFLNQLPTPRNWSAWLASDAPIRAIYRQSPDPLTPLPGGQVEADNPPMTKPGMVSVSVDGYGRLLSFDAIPANDEPVVPPVDPDTVFRAAGLDRANFQPAPLSFVPAHASDTIAEWKGPHPRIPNTQLTVEIASWKGRITQAEIVYPYQEANTAPSWVDRAINDFGLAVMLFGAVAIALLARHNWKQGRTDRRGALRIGAATFLLGALGWVGSVHPVTSAQMIDLFWYAGADLGLRAAILWMVYLGIEPAVRARYPHSIVTWNRLLAGRWMDARFWADVLMGAAMGSAMWVIAEFFSTRPDTLDVGGSRGLLFLLGARHWWGGLTAVLGQGVESGLLVFALICGLRRLVRYDLVAALVGAGFLTVLESPGFHESGVMLLVLFAIDLAIYTALAYVLMRVGLVATVSLIFFINTINTIWLGMDWKAWYAPYSIATLFLLLGIAGFAFWCALGRHVLTGGEELSASASRA